MWKSESNFETDFETDFEKEKQKAEMSQAFDFLKAHANQKESSIKKEREGEKQPMIARITPLGSNFGGGSYPDNSLPGGGEIDNSLPGGSGFRPPGNATLPSLPGIWPPPGKPNFPVQIPVDPGYGQPIFIGEGPENPIALPPGIYPPLPPTGSTGKVAILVWVIGVGYRWAVIDTSAIATLK